MVSVGKTAALYSGLIVMGAATGAGLGFLYGENIPLGHMGSYPPLFMIPGAGLGALVGLLVAFFVKFATRPRL